MTELVGQWHSLRNDTHQGKIKITGFNSLKKESKVVIELVSSDFKTYTETSVATYNPGDHTFTICPVGFSVCTFTARIQQNFSSKFPWNGTYTTLYPLDVGTVYFDKQN